MKRLLVSVVLAAFVAAMVTSSAAARPKKKRKGKGDKTPTSEQISVAMKKANVKWGMSRREVTKALVKQVKDHYTPIINKISNPVEEDRVRNEANDEIKAIKKSYVEFNGKTTGWDVSFLREEFTHNNDEALMVVRDKNSQNFYFFMGGRLWKWYKAFDASVFKAGSFKQFAGAVQRKFGDAVMREGEAGSGKGSRRWLQWQDKMSRLRAIDETEFYGFYCLVFDEKQTLGNLAQLRRNDDRRKNSKHSVVDSVTSGDGADPDDSPNIVDRITGKYRVREQAPRAEDGGGRGSSGKSRSKKRGSRATSGSSDMGDDDPLSGL